MVKATIKAPPCNTKEDGNKINFMGGGILCGRMGGLIRVIMLMVRRKGRERILTRMGKNILASGMLGCSMGRGRLSMRISKLRRANGPMARRIIHEQLIFSRFIYFLSI
jgi:hypothetical protein